MPTDPQRPHRSPTDASTRNTKLVGGVFRRSDEGRKNSGSRSQTSGDNRRCRRHRRDRVPVKPSSLCGAPGYLSMAGGPTAGAVEKLACSSRIARCVRTLGLPHKDHDPADRIREGRLPATSPRILGDHRSKDPPRTRTGHERHRRHIAAGQVISLRAPAVTWPRRVGTGSAIARTCHRRPNDLGRAS